MNRIRRPSTAQQLTPGQLGELKQEMAMLREFHALAQSIIKNSKGEVLLTALRRGFSAAEKAQKSKGAALQQKALIFTESRRTQEYLYQILEKTEFAGKVVLFNGTNTDPKSKEIYQGWLARNAGTDQITNSPTSDKRAALVEYFRDEAFIMIATEAAAEGINLQFCNLVVNYDLPWNPQRIEQRIGRCHRYGQKFDVVVVNFLNRSNAADPGSISFSTRSFASSTAFSGPATRCSALSSLVSISKSGSSPFTKSAARRSRSASSSINSSKTSNPKSTTGERRRGNSS